MKPSGHPFPHNSFVIIYRTEGCQEEQISSLAAHPEPTPIDLSSPSRTREQEVIKNDSAERVTVTSMDRWHFLA